MKNAMSKNDILSGVRKLDVVERLGIVTDIWDEIKESRALETISGDEKRTLLNRLANYRANPGSATDWTELKTEAHRAYAEES